MQKVEFEAFGTVFHVLVDAEDSLEKVTADIRKKTDEFDQHFSRFIEKSEARAFSEAAADTYQISPQMSEFLMFAQELRTLTNGAFDPAVGGFLEEAGYSHDYRFTENAKVGAWQMPKWSVSGQQLTIDGSIIFDIGAFGKGYWVDEISRLLTQAGFPFHLVDGSGDMYGTEKKDGSPWIIAIEWPGKPDRSIGEVPLRFQGIAVSDIFRRQWGQWNHVIDLKHHESVKKITGCAVVAPNCMIADALSTALMVSEKKCHDQLRKKYNAHSLIYTADRKIHGSKNWPGSFYLGSTTKTVGTAV